MTDVRHCVAELHTVAYCSCGALFEGPTEDAALQLLIAHQYACLPDLDEPEK